MIKKYTDSAKGTKTKKGFTLIELLMVVALIAILSTMILIMLDSGREKAEVNRYVSYAAQMHRLVADSVAAGQFDKGKINLTAKEDVSFCLGGGDTDYDCGTGGAKIESGTGDVGKVYDALTYLTDFPKATEENAFSPYDKAEGVSMTINPDGHPTNNIRVQMYLIKSDDDNDPFIEKVCNSMKWKHDGNGYCYILVPLHSRL